MQTIHRLWPWLASAGSGILLVLCYPPFHSGWLVWFALIPLLCALWFGRVERPKSLGWTAGLIFFAGTFHWLHELGPLFGAPLLRGIPLLLGAYLALYPMAWAWFMARVLVPDAEARRFSSSGKNMATGALGASAWVSLEWLRGWVIYGFSWNGLGVALHAPGDLTMVQIAEFTGVWGVSWLVAFVNIMAVIIVRRICADIGPDFMKRIRWEFSATMLLVALVFSYGARVMMRPPRENLTTLSVAVVQPNIPQPLKLRAEADPEVEKEILTVLDQRTELAAMLHPQLVLWPETATARGWQDDDAICDFHLRQARRSDAPFIFGATEFLERGAFNAAVALTRRGEKAQVYHKQHLVPFGEFLPARPLTGWFAGFWVPGDFTRGDGPVVFRFEEEKVPACAPLICFEDTNGDITRRFIPQGAELLLNLTNDGWFARSAGLEAHVANSFLRAVETRRPLIRATNTGATCAVDIHGRVERWLDPHTVGMAVRNVTVPRGLPQTFYVRWGDWLPRLCTGLLALTLWRRWRKKASPAISPQG